MVFINNKCVMNVLLFPAFKTSLDPTRILSRPADAEIVSGTTAQLICQAECDKSLRDSFQLVWRKDGNDIPLSAEENSRSVAGCCREASVFAFVLFIYLCAPGSVQQGGLWIFDDNLVWRWARKHLISFLYVIHISGTLWPMVCCG